MDLNYLSNNNGTDMIGDEFIKSHSGIAVPYLIVICLAMFTGTIGNILVICAVLINKVSSCK